MSAFKALRDVSIAFENYSREVTAELFTAKASEPFEDIVAKKLRDINLYTSKFRLLEAKCLTDDPQINGLNKNNQTILEYEEIVSSKLIERLAVKAITQTKAVKNLLTTPAKRLTPELVETKCKVIDALTEYSRNETQLRFTEGVLDETQHELLEVQRGWDEALGQLRNTPKVTMQEESADSPLYKRLQSIKEKMDLMRWLVGRLVTSRSDEGYDWLSDPHRRLRALAIARRTRDVYE